MMHTFWQYGLGNRNSSVNVDFSKRCTARTHCFRLQLIFWTIHWPLICQDLAVNISLENQCINQDLDIAYSFCIVKYAYRQNKSLKG